MSKRISSLLALLTATSLLVLACQASAPVAPTIPIEPTAKVQSTSAEPTAPSTEAPKPTQVDEPAAVVQPTSPVSETQATEPTDPITADPSRPGFTLDGSPSLGDPAAPVVIVDFSDFQ